MKQEIFHLSIIRLYGEPYAVHHLNECLQTLAACVKAGETDHPQIAKVLQMMGMGICDGSDVTAVWPDAKRDVMEMSKLFPKVCFEITINHGSSDPWTVKATAYKIIDGRVVERNRTANAWEKF